MDAVPSLIRVFAGVFVAAPLPTLAAVWWAIGAGLARAAKGLGLPKWVVWAGPAALVWLLWKRRQGRAAVALVVGCWLLALWAFPDLRFAFGVAIPTGIALGVLVQLARDYPHLSPWLALQCAIAERRHREVLDDAVPASAGEGARVLSVKRTGPEEFEAQVIGPPGTSHADLVDSLRGTLAESVLSMSGRKLAHVVVIGDGAKGAVRVRCSTSSPYGQNVALEDL